MNKSIDCENRESKKNVMKKKKKSKDCKRGTNY